MPTALAGPLERMRSALSTIGLGQKVVIGLLAAGLVLGGLVFYRWITAPTYAPLFSNLASTDASAIADELDAAGVEYELADGGGTIMVAKDAVYDLRLDMSGLGLPAGDDTGYALMEEQGITTSEFQQQKTYQRALEGELAATLESLEGVRQATVHLALPEEEVFASDEAEPTASVLLDLAAGTSLDSGQVQAVTNLVSSSIEGMDAEQVTVADSSGAVLSAPGQGVTSAAGDARSQMEQDYEARLASNAQVILDRVFGPGRAQVSVRADLDLDQRSTTSETHTYEQGTPPISESTTTEDYAGTGAAVGGVLGPENQPDAGAGGDSTYTKESTTSNNAVGTTVETVEAAPGTVNRLTVSVVMDDAVAGGANQAQIQDLIGNAVGLDVARGDDITVAAMAFDTTAADRAAEELAAAQEAEEQAQLWSMVRTGGIALGIALLVLIVWLRSRRRSGDEDEEDYEALELTDDVMAELDRIRVASARAVPAVDDAALELEAAERAKVRGEIATMVSEKPDEVAAMLRGWLSESGVK
ncbi:flagellar basal-body MS-ring/collar protein FliF [Geodermatophilus sp. DSM 44513]|uniref:flagellar basal-body MS-ring/collar protein FliF n=1 Tax=Geodermatophilus sp. DSM 44513 TaxID=1528104 RepID=UPI0012827D7B|nr:flagellar basal-body MS-ring/collar protein FliF [Geodermatophilus sp. DSM 44513]WNV76467.1 flagellar basal-body MS-ring/collar protein FliF [Geodermatophilus sp. DSM 44513]